MGTRGTLKVYLNDELKIRQYNQWDSYPTGQFADICQFFGTDWLVKELAYRLGYTRFYTREEYERAIDIFDGKVQFGEGVDNKTTDIEKACHIYVLRNRDYGANILLQMCSLCYNDTRRYPESLYAIVDWRYAFGEDNEDLESEEGNYVIRIYKSTEENSDKERIHFKLSGKWHDVEREFDMDYIPTDDEIKAWEGEGYNR